MNSIWYQFRTLGKISFIVTLIYIWCYSGNGANHNYGWFVRSLMPNHLIHFYDSYKRNLTFLVIMCSPNSFDIRRSHKTTNHFCPICLHLSLSRVPQARAIKCSINEWGEPNASSRKAVVICVYRSVGRREATHSDETTWSEVSGQYWIFFVAVRESHDRWQHFRSVKRPMWLPAVHNDTL